MSAPEPRDPNHYAKIIDHVHSTLPTARPGLTHLDPWGRLTDGPPRDEAFYYRQARGL